MNPTDKSSTNGPSYDQVVTIYLANGQTIQFAADYNFGLGEFVMDYEAYVEQGVKQPKFRYQMQDTTQKKSNHINVQFKDIVCLYLAKK